MRSDENKSTDGQSDSITPVRKRRITATPEVAHARKQMDEAVNVLKTMSQNSNSAISEVDLFCKLLAAKIKKFDQETMEEIMHEIDELMYDKRQNLCATKVPRSSPSRTTSSQSQYSGIWYEDSQSPHSIPLNIEEYPQANRPKSQNQIHIMSKDIIRHAYRTAHNTCTDLDYDNHM